MRGEGLAARACATKDGADTDQEPEVIPASSVVGAVDAVVVVEKSNDEARYGCEAVEQASEPARGVVSVRARGDEAAVEVPGEEHQDDDGERQGEHKATTRAAALVSGAGDRKHYWLPQSLRFARGTPKRLYRIFIL